MAAETSKEPSMTKDEAPDWVPTRAFLDAFASLGLEKPPSLLADTPAYEPPRPREPEEPEPEPEPDGPMRALTAEEEKLGMTGPMLLKNDPHQAVENAPVYKG